MRNIFTINIDKELYKNYFDQLDFCNYQKLIKMKYLSLEFNQTFQEQINLLLFENFKALSQDYQNQIELSSELCDKEFISLRVIFETSSEEAQQFYETNYNLIYNSFEALFNAYHGLFMDKAKELGYLK